MDIGFEGFRYSWGKNRYAIKSIDCAAVFAIGAAASTSRVAKRRKNVRRL